MVFLFGTTRALFCLRSELSEYRFAWNASTYKTPPWVTLKLPALFVSPGRRSACFYESVASMGDGTVWSKSCLRMRISRFFACAISSNLRASFTFRFLPRAGLPRACRACSRFAHSTCQTTSVGRRSTSCKSVRFCGAFLPRQPLAPPRLEGRRACTWGWKRTILRSFLGVMIVPAADTCHFFMYWNDLRDISASVRTAVRLVLKRHRACRCLLACSRIRTRSAFRGSLYSVLLRLVLYQSGYLRHFGTSTLPVGDIHVFCVYRLLLNLRRRCLRSVVSPARLRQHPLLYARRPLRPACVERVHS